MFAQISSGATLGINACSVLIEVDIARGLPQMQIVGLPDASINESRERVRAAIKASGFELPLGRIIVNMAPADLRKEGTHFDLPIAIGILLASGQVKNTQKNYWFLGELSLNGQLRPTNGVLPITAAAKEQGIQAIIVPRENAYEAALIEGIEVYAAHSLQEVAQILGSETEKQKYFIPSQNLEVNSEQAYGADFKYVKGQYQAKRALEIAAAGGHNILFVGEPGGGKSMLAQCLPSIMPPMSKEMALDVTKVYSVAGLLKSSGKFFIHERPFRAPHHSISGAGLIGGGSSPKPGEVSLAHNGVLFLDELAEFDKKTLDNLRQPIESGEVIISRARFSVQYPSRFLLIGACNPFTGTRRPQGKNQLIISAPLWDRFGLIVWVPPLKPSELMKFNPDAQENSAQIKKRVVQAWENQKKRQASLNNAHLGPKEIKEFCKLNNAAEELLKQAVVSLSLTGRTYDHVLRTARTIADLASQELIEEEHIAEAIQYRVSQEALLAKST